MSPTLMATGHLLLGGLAGLHRVGLTDLYSSGLRTATQSIKLPHQNWPTMETEDRRHLPQKIARE